MKLNKQSKLVWIIGIAVMSTGRLLDICNFINDCLQKIACSVFFVQKFSIKITAQLKAIEVCVQKDFCVIQQISPFLDLGLQTLLTFETHES